METLNEKVLKARAIISDIWYDWEGKGHDFNVMIEDSEGIEFNIAIITLSKEEEEDGSQETLYAIAYKIAHEMGYLLEGEAC